MGSSFMSSASRPCIEAIATRDQRSSAVSSYCYTSYFLYCSPTFSTRWKRRKSCNCKRQVKRLASFLRAWPHSTKWIQRVISLSLGYIAACSFSEGACLLSWLCSCSRSPTCRSLPIKLSRWPMWLSSWLVLGSMLTCSRRSLRSSANVWTF